MPSGLLDDKSDVLSSWKELLVSPVGKSQGRLQWPEEATSLLSLRGILCLLPLPPLSLSLPPHHFPSFSAPSLLRPFLLSSLSVIPPSLGRPACPLISSGLTFVSAAPDLTLS